MPGYGLNSTGSGEGPIAAYCEHGNERLLFINWVNYFYQFCEYWFLRIKKAVRLHATEALGWGRWGVALTILDLAIRWEWVVSVTPRPRLTPGGRTPPVPIVKEAEWASEPVWTQIPEEKSLSRTVLHANIICAFLPHVFTIHNLNMFRFGT
jgi:hypothetical protein